MNIRISVLNYNGEKLLRECLPSVVEAASRSSHRVKVSIVDNRSTDGSVELLRREFPGVEIWSAPENRVLCSYNDYLPSVPEPVVILLNNDIRVAPDFVDPLADYFDRHQDAFMVTPKCLSFDGARYEGGRCRATVKFGLFWSASVFPGYEEGTEASGFTMSAGFGAFKRDVFLSLGGYDDLFLPGRLEDNDICFRAWRQGWKCFYEPRSVVYHMGAASFNEKYGVRRTLVLGHRNSFLFFWKNISDPLYWLQHVCFLAPRLLFALLSGKSELAEGFFRALSRLSAALKRRQGPESGRRIANDRQIFKMVE